MSREATAWKKTKELLDSLDDSVSRVQVKTESGALKWKRPDEVLLGDVIQTKRSGKPIVMQGSPGKSAPKKSKSQGKSYANKAAFRSLLGALKNEPDSHEVLQYILEGMAEETESLRREREQAEAEGESVSALSMRAIKAYSAIANTWLERKKQFSEDAEIDFDSPAITNLVNFLLETIQEVMNDCKIRHEVINLVFTQLAARMSDRRWENEVRRRMKG